MQELESQLRTGHILAEKSKLFQSPSQLGRRRRSRDVLIRDALTL